MTDKISDEINRRVPEHNGTDHTRGSAFYGTCPGEPLGSFCFERFHTDGEARTGRLHLHHGTVDTPVFMPVGTAGSVKSLSPEDLQQLQAEIILGNTYHLYLRPGTEVIKTFGGLHNFIAWDKPILTDSGGFQIFSLAKLSKITEDGARFQSHLDGSTFFLSPENAVDIQETLGSDIHMVLDECTPPGVNHRDAKTSMQRSMRWARRCRQQRRRTELAQFGIVQGSVYADLRRDSAKTLVDMDFEGYAIGGLSVGESKTAMGDMVEASCQVLPQDRPRYLMGVGTPLDMLEAISRGVDMFDCVMPTRNARNGCLFTSTGKVSIKNQKHRLDDDALDPRCRCYTCRTFSRAYLRHLFVSGEVTYLRLATLHNLTYYLDLMKTIRESIERGKFQQLLHHHRNLWGQDPPKPQASGSLHVTSQTQP